MVATAMANVGIVYDSLERDSNLQDWRMDAACLTEASRE